MTLSRKTFSSAPPATSLPIAIVDSPVSVYQAMTQLAIFLCRWPESEIIPRALAPNVVIRTTSRRDRCAHPRPWKTYSAWCYSFCSSLADRRWVALRQWPAAPRRPGRYRKGAFRRPGIPIPDHSGRNHQTPSSRDANGGTWAESRSPGHYPRSPQRLT